VLLVAVLERQVPATEEVAFAPGAQASDILRASEVAYASLFA
jgi:hypothetical protein